jgi:hypothetical protein
MVLSARLAGHSKALAPSASMSPSAAVGDATGEAEAACEATNGENRGAGAPAANNSGSSFKAAVRQRKN